MSFFLAFKKAMDDGVSVDDFMKTWHSMNRHSMKQDVDLNVNLDQDLKDDKISQNLRKGDRLTSSAMMDKRKRQGWISPNPINGAPFFAEHMQGHVTIDEAACEMESLKIPDFSATSTQTAMRVKSPRPLPRRRNLQPPSYERAHEYEKVDGNNIKLLQQTERKFPHSLDDDSESSLNKEHLKKNLPNVSNLQQLEADQQTLPKALYVDFDRTRRKETPSGPYEPVDDIMLMSKEDQMELMDTLRNLQEEQMTLKAKLREHDVHLTTLMSRQPSVRQTLRKTVNRRHGHVELRNQALTKIPKVQEKANGLDDGDNDHIYVQIEQLYANFCKMHVPANSIKWMLKLKQSRQLLHSKDDLDLVHDSFARRENSQGYWDIASVEENLSLQKENDELKQKVKMLEAKLEERPRRPTSPELKPDMSMSSMTQLKSPDNPLLPMTDQKSSDTPMPTISTMARFCNVRLSKITNGAAKTNEQTVILKKKSSESTISSHDSIVAGCPVEAHSGFGSVNPVKIKFEWRISNYSRKLEMERNGQQMKIVSNPFHINHNGYLGQLEVYLNGNNSGQDRGMSVFLRILKGTYDHHLHWPARLCIVVELINQVEGRQESIKGGGDGFSEFEYRKPTDCSNDSCDCWGFVKFASHDLIAQRNYIYRDSILLGISVKIL